MADRLNFLHGGNIYQIKRMYDKENIIDFSANINPLGLNENLKQEIIKCIDKIIYYPDITNFELLEALAEYWNIRKENILLGNGSTELIYLVINAFNPKKVMIPVPTFCEYERAAKIINSKIHFLKLQEEEGFSLNTISSDIKSDMVFICNPNNPTGNLLLKNQRLPFKNSSVIVIDETCMDFLPGEREHTMVYKAISDKRLIVLRSFTKFFALPGLRIGYLIAHKDVINFLQKRQPPWNINIIAQVAAKFILNDKEYIQKTKVFIEKERRFLFEKILNIKGLIPFPSVTNFILIKIRNNNSCYLTKKLIKDYGILIRDCSNFRGLSNNKFIRVAIRLHSENVKLINVLSNLKLYEN